MIASVSLEAERELIDGTIYYAREANAELGLAFIAEFERSVAVLCTYPRLGPIWCGSTRRFPLRMIALAPKTNTLYYVAFVDRGDRRRIISLPPGDAS